MKSHIENALRQSYIYSEYRTLFTELVDQGKTTGYNQSEYYVEVTRLNLSRTNRLDKKARFIPEMEAGLANLSAQYLMLVLTEAWCGDAAQTLPLLNHLAEASDQLDLRVVLRDEHPELMNGFLTNDARAIPKAIFLDPDTHEVLGTWGPRPAPAQKMAMDYKHKTEPKEDYKTFSITLHKWYAKDKTKTTQEELLALFGQLETARKSVAG